MDWVILDGFDSESQAAGQIGGLLRSRLEEAGKRYAYFAVNGMEIKACRSCGGCGYKSPGQCVMNDDLHAILRAVAPSRVLVFLTPIRFGGYPSQLKKVLERFMCLGTPYYMVHSGHLLHPMRYGQKSLLSIGVAEMEFSSQADTFRLLAERNARNLVCAQTKALVLSPAGAPEWEIGPVLEEALQW